MWSKKRRRMLRHEQEQKAQKAAVQPSISSGII